MADMTLSPGAFVRASSVEAITEVETTLTTWTSSKVFLLLIILQVVRMITASKDGFATSQTLRFLNSLKDWVFKL